MAFGDFFGGIPGIGGMINSFLHPEAGYKAAEDPLQRGYEESQRFLSPYLQQGQEQYGPLMDARNALLNPAELENKWASSYETSPSAQQLLKQNQAGGLDAASSMGLMGSSAALGNIQQGAGNIVSADRQRFLDDLMQKYMSGIGLGQNIYGIGAQSASNLADLRSKMAENMAGLEYGRINAPGDMLRNILAMAAKAGMQYYGGGAGGMM